MRTPAPEEPVGSAQTAGRSPSLAEAIAFITAGTSRSQSLARLLAAACELAGVSQGALAVLDRAGGVAEVLHHGVTSEAPVRRFPVGAGRLGEVARSPVPLVLHDVPGTALHPDGHPGAADLLGVPVRSHGRCLGLLLLGEEHRRHEFDREAVVATSALAGVAAYLLEVTQADALAERRRTWLNRSSRLAAELQPPLLVDDALEMIADAAVEASGARTVLVISVPSPGAPYPAAMSGATPTLDRDSTELLDVAVRAVAETGEPGEVDLGGDQHALLAPLGEHLSAPSILVILHPPGAVPDSHETDLLGAFAEQAGLGMDRVQALQDRATMAVVTDRDRIARELHDVVIQRLFATGLHLQKSRSLATDPELQERLELTAHDLDQTIRAIRGTIFDLRDQPRQSLRATLRDLVDRHAPTLGFVPTVHLSGPVDHPLSPDAQERLTAVLDQALTNVARHAAATSARIDVHITDDLVRVRVSDDGRGLPGDVVETGLAALRRRIALTGGTLDLWDGDPSGATLVAQLPRD
jgi:signal transduction histidine kinase